MYKERPIDNKIRKDFQNNTNFNYLKSVEVSGGGIRGLHPSKVEFKYPITAIAGVNGSGKSTLLALVSCAFHNTSSFVPFGKNSNYYTYSDFFVFAPEEKGLVSQIEIKSKYLTDIVPKPPKVQGEDIRKKKPNGKWNDYNTRPERVVSYLGINRIIPPSEDSKYRGYRISFKEKKLDDDVKNYLTNSLTTIFGQKYTDLKLKEYKNCHLFYVTNRDQYTGYNMGAGENAVLTLLYEILTAGEGTLIVVDEIELGVHVSAQKKLIDVLKELCKIKHCQIVCSTHSQYILDSLPIDGRVLIQSSGIRTTITQEISSEFALSALSGQNQPEMSVFVEDEVAKLFLQNVLCEEIRKRIDVKVIGSADNSIPAQMEAHFREGSDNFCVIMDGDKQTNKNKTIKGIINKLEDRKESEADKNDYFSERITYLPGNCNPEKYLLQSIINALDKTYLEHAWTKKTDEIVDICNKGIAAGTHSEFWKVHELLALPKETVISDVLRFYKNTYRSEISVIEVFIGQRLVALI